MEEAQVPPFGTAGNQAEHAPKPAQAVPARPGHQRPFSLSMGKGKAY